MHRWHHNSAKNFGQARQCMGIMTSRLRHNLARSLLWKLGEPKFWLLFCKPVGNPQPSCINLDQTLLMWFRFSVLLGLLVPVLRVQHLVRHRHGDGQTGPRTPDDRLPIDHLARLHQLRPQPVHLHHLQQRVPESLQEVLQSCRVKVVKKYWL